MPRHRVMSHPPARPSLPLSIDHMSYIVESRRLQARAVRAFLGQIAQETARLLRRGLTA